jgi:hypothetical protein
MCASQTTEHVPSELAEGHTSTCRPSRQGSLEVAQTFNLAIFPNEIPGSKVMGDLPCPCHPCFLCFMWYHFWIFVLLFLQ